MRLSSRSLIFFHRRVVTFWLKDPDAEWYFKLKKLHFNYDSPNRQCEDEDRTGDGVKTQQQSDK